MNKPSIGQIMKVRGITCRIVKVRPMGTVDVVSLDSTYSFCISGLMF